MSTCRFLFFAPLAMNMTFVILHPLDGIQRATLSRLFSLRFCWCRRCCYQGYFYSRMLLLQIFKVVNMNHTPHQLQTQWMRECPTLVSIEFSFSFTMMIRGKVQKVYMYRTIIIFQILWKMVDWKCTPLFLSNDNWLCEFSGKSFCDRIKFHCHYNSFSAYDVYRRRNGKLLIEIVCQKCGYPVNYNMLIKWIEFQLENFFPF